MIALVVITDGRDCVHETVPSALAMLEGDITERWLYDDSGDQHHTDELGARYEPHGFRVFNHPGGRQGFGGAIRHVWATLADQSAAEYVWWSEDDFTYQREVHIARMIAVLSTNAELAQIALRRQAWNPPEIAAGGVVEQHPDDYTDRSDVFGNHWLEHRRFFTTNPSLVRRSIIERGWPDIEHSEGHFGQALAAEGWRFAYWGQRADAPWVHHISRERAGVGY